MIHTHERACRVAMALSWRCFSQARTLSGQLPSVARTGRLSKSRAFGASKCRFKPCPVLLALKVIAEEHLE